MVLQTTAFPYTAATCSSSQEMQEQVHMHMYFMGHGLLHAHRHKIGARQNKHPNCNFRGFTITFSFISKHNNFKAKSTWTACKCAQKLSLPDPQIYLKISVSVVYSFTNSRLACEARLTKFCTPS